MHHLATALVFGLLLLAVTLSAFVDVEASGLSWHRRKLGYALLIGGVSGVRFGLFGTDVGLMMVAAAVIYSAFELGNRRWTGRRTTPRPANLSDSATDGLSISDPRS